MIKPSVRDTGLIENGKVKLPEIEQRKSWIEFYSPSQLRAYVPPAGHMLVGDCHVKRGDVFAIGGAPGIGKSRALTALALAGATGQDWFGLQVHRKFKTMILQNENGLFRLSREFKELAGANLDDYIRICAPPPNGMAFRRHEFTDVLRQNVEEFQPDVFGFDPWNSAARDDGAKDYLETFDLVRSVLPPGDAAPALGVVAHTRKPRENEFASGRALMNLFAGSYVLVSVPRSAFVMQAATSDVMDNRVIWTCCKNNDGTEGRRSAWHRGNGLFLPCDDFDWEEFDSPAGGKPRGITKEDVERVFQSGHRSMCRKEAVAELAKATGFKEKACYAALGEKGRFAEHLTEEDGHLRWAPCTR